MPIICFCSKSASRRDVQSSIIIGEDQSSTANAIQMKESQRTAAVSQSTSQSRVASAASVSKQTKSSQVSKLLKQTVLSCHLFDNVLSLAGCIHGRPI